MKLDFCGHSHKYDAAINVTCLGRCLHINMVSGSSQQPPSTTDIGSIADSPLTSSRQPFDTFPVAITIPSSSFESCVAFRSTTRERREGRERERQADVVGGVAKMTWDCFWLRTRGLPLASQPTRCSSFKRPRPVQHRIGVTSDFKIFNKVRILSFVRAWLETVHLQSSETHPG